MIASTSHQRLRDLFLLVPELVSILQSVLVSFKKKKSRRLYLLCFFKGNTGSKL